MQPSAATLPRDKAERILAGEQTIPNPKVADQHRTANGKIPIFR